MSVEKYVELTQIVNKDYRILHFEIKMPYPTPLQWKFCMSEFDEHLSVLKHLNCKSAFIMDVKVIGLISVEYIMDFINTLIKYEELLETNFIATSVIYEGTLISTLFELLKMFYKTKKPIEFVSNMTKAVEFIDSNNKENKENKH